MKKRFLTETMPQLPQFHVKDNVYSVCFGCKKGYCTLQKNHVCSHREAHLEVVKKLCAERDAEKLPAVEEEVPAAVKEESDYMRLMTEHRALRKEFEDFKKYMMKELQKTRLQSATAVAPNPFIGMPDEQFDAIETDKLSDEQRAIYEAEDDRRAKEVRARKAAEPNATPLVSEKDDEVAPAAEAVVTVVESEAEEEAAEAVEDAPAEPNVELVNNWANSIYSKPARTMPRPEDIEPELHAPLMEAAEAQKRIVSTKRIMAAAAEPVNLSNAAGGGPRLPAPPPFQPPATPVYGPNGVANLLTSTKRKVAPKATVSARTVLDSYDGRIDESRLSAEEIAMWRAEQARIARLAMQYAM